MKTGIEQDAQESEPGAEDNRLSLDPNAPEFTFAADWEDGEEYNVELRVRQISPGEFEVIEGSGEAVEGEPEGETDDETKEEAPGANGRNPVIREAIARRYSK